MNQLLTAWISWCGGVTFTLLFVFSVMYRAGAHTAAYRRNALTAAVVFALLTAALAAYQVLRLW